jgi:hypothetical protein
MALSAMNYLINNIYLIGQNLEENIILIGPGHYTKILTGCASKDKYGK